MKVTVKPVYIAAAVIMMRAEGCPPAIHNIPKLTGLLEESGKRARVVLTEELMYVVQTVPSTLALLNAAYYYSAKSEEQRVSLFREVEALCTFMALCASCIAKNEKLVIKESLLALPE